MLKAEGEVKQDSHAGGSIETDDFVPIDFDYADYPKLQLFNVYLKHRLIKGMGFAIGFMNERWNINE